MYLCETCSKGQLEMCPYFKEHFLESGAAVRNCPEYEEGSDATAACGRARELSEWPWSKSAARNE